MVGPNKILTVSYGTFSCTLEGFDDPFSTMKVIAEYFRDLAANDRFFGAEPPTPDVQMLHALAQKSTASPVDAAVKDDGVHLTQATSEPEPAPVVEPAPAPAAEPAAQTPAPEPAVEAEVPVAPPVISAPETNDDLSAASIAAKLQRIRSVVAASVADRERTRPLTFEDMETDDLTDTVAYAGKPAPTQPVPTPQAATVEVAEPAPEPFPAPTAETPVEEASDVAPEMSDKADDAFSSADFEDASPVVAEEYLEDEPVAAPQESATEVLRRHEPEDTALSAIIAATDPNTFAPKAPEAEQSLSEQVLGPVDEFQGLDAEIKEPASEDDEPAAVEEPEETAEPESRVAPLGVDMDDLADAVAHLRTRDTPRPQRFSPTLEQLNASETEKTDASLAGMMPTAAEDDVPLGNEPTETLEDEDVVLGQETDEAPVLPAQDMQRKTIASLDQDETVERLMAQTDDKLKDDTTKRRQSALSHLKAAVAATIADRIGPKDSATEAAIEPQLEDADSSYRADLASIVRARPVEDGEETLGQERDRIAPLVLVPQDRVDTPDTDTMSVRPRRVSRSEISAQEDTRALDMGFADYAEQSGAKELSELLEAAAAYLSTVEGKEHFSRPEVMHMVMRHDREQAFSREDSLRSFGDLLRNGTIEKIDRGQFVISSDSRFVANG